MYLLTLAPTVTTNDAGRFQTAAPLLGLGHPTGYPTFILFGKLFTLLPFGDVAYRVNLMSAFFGGVAVALLFLVAIELGARVLPAAGAALIFAFSATFWSQATMAEVYTMHAAFLLGVTYLLLRWRRTGRGGYVFGAALIAGVSLGNNAGMVLLAPAFMVLLLARRLRQLSARMLAGSIALLLLGLSVYAYVPIRGFAGAWYNYGDPVNDWEDVWRLVSGARFHGLMVFPPDSLQPVGIFLDEVFLQASLPYGYALGPLLLLGGAYGAWALVRENRVAGLALLLGFGCTLLYALSYQIDDIAVYYIPVYLFLTLFVAAGASRLAEARGSRLLLGLPLVVALFMLYANYEEQDKSNYYAERVRSEAMLERLPEDAVLYGKVPIIPITYLQQVEDQREDVTLRWLDGATLERHLAPDVESERPVYFISDPRYNEDYLNAAEPHARPQQEDGLIRLLPR